MNFQRYDSEDENTYTPQFSINQSFSSYCITFESFSHLGPVSIQPAKSPHSVIIEGIVEKLDQRIADFTTMFDIPASFKDIPIVHCPQPGIIQLEFLRQ